MENTADVKPKPQFKIDLFQTARVHTEQFIESFDTEAEAKEYIEKLCEEKGIENPDYEIQLLEVTESSETTVDNGVDAAPATDEEE